MHVCYDDVVSVGHVVLVCVALTWCICQLMFAYTGSSTYLRMYLCV